MHPHSQVNAAPICYAPTISHPLCIFWPPWLPTTDRPLPAIPLLSGHHIVLLCPASHLHFFFRESTLRSSDAPLITAHECLMSGRAALAFTLVKVGPVSAVIERGGEFLKDWEKGEVPVCCWDLSFTTSFLSAPFCQSFLSGMQLLSMRVGFLNNHHRPLLFHLFPIIEMRKFGQSSSPAPLTSKSRGCLSQSGLHKIHLVLCSFFFVFFPSLSGFLFRPSLGFDCLSPSS